MIKKTGAKSHAKCIVVLWHRRQTIRHYDIPIYIIIIIVIITTIIIQYNKRDTCRHLCLTERAYIDKLSSCLCACIYNIIILLCVILLLYYRRVLRRQRFSKTFRIARARGRAGVVAIRSRLTFCSSYSCRLSIIAERHCGDDIYIIVSSVDVYT